MTIVDLLFDFREDLIRFGRKTAKSNLQKKLPLTGAQSNVFIRINEAVDNQGFFLTKDGPTVISKKHPQFSSRKLPK